MTNRLMISVAAAALIAGTGFANAQGTGMSREAPSAAAPAQQNAPTSERRESDRGTSAGKNQRADEKNMPDKNKSSQNDNAKTGKDMKAEGSQDRNGMKPEGSEDRNG